MENDGSGTDRLRAKSARLKHKAVEEALSALRDRIQAINKDNSAEYAVSEAVAFGDFLSQDARVQPADVGVRLTLRNTDVDASLSQWNTKLKKHSSSSCCTSHPRL
jgi:hypothetical protein